MKTLKTLLATTCLVASSICLNAQTASWTYGTNAATLSPTTGNLGIGLTATTANKLSLQATSSTQNGLKINNSAGSTTLLSHYNGGLTIGASTTPPTNGLYVPGNVGIGTANPQAKLDVAGSINLTGNINISNGVLSVNRVADGGGAIEIRNNAKNQNGIASSWRIYNMTGPYGNSLQFWAYDNIGCGGGLCSSRLTLMDNGNVGIGTMTPYYKLDVEGTIRAREVVVNLNTGADFVFEEGYSLRPLKDVSDFIIANKHLPEIPSAANMVENGLDMGEFQIKLLQKIEELTLYIIEQDKKIVEQDKRIMELEKK